MPPITAFDIVVLLLVVLGAVMGALRGFVQEVLSLFAWVAAAIALKLFFRPVSAAAERWVGTEAGGMVLAFVLVFILTYAVFRALAGRLGNATRSSVVGPVDRFLGFGFGALKAVLGASLLFLGVTLAYSTLGGGDEPKPEWLTASRTGPLLTVTSRLIVDFVERRRDGEPAARASETSGDGYSDRARDALDELIGPKKKT